MILQAAKKLTEEEKLALRLRKKLRTVRKKTEDQLRVLLRMRPEGQGGLSVAKKLDWGDDWQEAVPWLRDAARNEYARAGLQQLSDMGKSGLAARHRVRQAARVYAKKRAGLLSGHTLGVRMDHGRGELVQATRRGLAKVIDVGMAGGKWTPNKLAKKVAQSYWFSPKRAGVVAGNELRMARAAGKVVAARQGSGMMEKRWAPQGDDPCDVCLANEAEGWIPLDGVFQSGDGEPTAHPNCECELEIRKARI